MKNMLRHYESGGFEDDEPDKVDVLEEKEAHQEQESSRLSDLVYRTDPDAKALTGRTLERVARETGISRERMFPENKKILYVGDPWQRMGKELDNANFTLIDYEFGDIASFIKDESEFRSNAAIKIERLLSRIEELKQGDILREDQLLWIQQFEQLVFRARDVSDSARNIEDYPKAAEAWNDAKKFIEEQYAKDLEDIDENKSAIRAIPSGNLTQSPFFVVPLGTTASIASGVQGYFWLAKSDFTEIEKRKRVADEGGHEVGRGRGWGKSEN